MKEPISFLSCHYGMLSSMEIPLSNQLPIIVSQFKYLCTVWYLNKMSWHVKSIFEGDAHKMTRGWGVERQDQYHILPGVDEDRFRFLIRVTRQENFHDCRIWGFCHFGFFVQIHFSHKSDWPCSNKKVFLV